MLNNERRLSVHGLAAVASANERTKKTRFKQGVAIDVQTRCAIVFAYAEKNMSIRAIAKLFGPSKSSVQRFVARVRVADMAFEQQYELYKQQQQLHQQQQQSVEQQPIEQEQQQPPQQQIIHIE